MREVRSVFRGLFMAFGMFSTIPQPKLWDDSSTKHMMPFLPLVGFVVGFVWWVAADILDYFSRWVGVILAPAVLILIPILLTGLIHLDGFMDTSDAILSRRKFEEKLRILKDPHTGAFAVIMVALLFIFQYAALLQVFSKAWVPLSPLLIIPIVSRGCSAMSVLCLRPLTQDGYVNMFKPDSPLAHRIVTAVLTLSAFPLVWLLAGFTGIIVAGAVLLGYVAAMLYASKNFEFRGISGDLAGFSLVISELCGLVALAVQ